MSRDWTPQELNSADKYMVETHGKSLRYTRLYLIQPDGTKIPTESDNIVRMRSQYKELGFLYDKLPETYIALSKHPKYRNRVLREIEEKLEYYVLHNNSNGNDSDPIWLWYIGKLDSNFYYNQYNNELLHEYIIEQVNKLKGGKKNV